MVLQEMGWSEAIILVLQDADEPLHYQEIARLIGERGLRELSGATPVATVRGQLSQMTSPGNRYHDSRIQRISRGVYQFVDPTSLSHVGGEPEQFDDDDDIDEESESGPRVVGVPAFGLFWEKEKVNWGRGSSGILGRQAVGSKAIDFSDQQGVYILHKDRSVV